MGFHAPPSGVGTTVDFSEIEAGAIITESEGISSNDNDTTIPTSAAVKDYADTGDAGRQPLDAELTALAGLTSAANKVPYFTASETAGLLDFLDQDDMSSNSATAVASQQSIKAYVDNAIPSVPAAENAAGVNAGTATDEYVTADALAGSNFGIRYIQLPVFDWTEEAATGDGAYYFHVPAGLDGMNLVEVHAELITAGTTGTIDIQLHNVDNALDMLSTKLTVDSGETGSDTAATAAVINTSNDHINENDVVRVDIDAVHTTPSQGLIVTLGFQLP